MRLTGSIIILACIASIGGCAATVPTELVDARAAYQRASTGPAAELAPADLHVAEQALARAEDSFADESDSYRTRDLAYVAQRKAQMAGVKASIATARNNQVASDAKVLSTQEELLQKQKQDLSRTNSALLASEQSRATADRALIAERESRKEADAKAVAARAALAKLASVKEEARGTVITLSGSVLFRSNESVLMPGAEARLDQVVAAFGAETERHMVVEGYADSRGSDAHNLELSQRRAEAVRSYMVQKGYPSDRVSAKGMGEVRPIADNTTSEGRANNRRVEIVLANPGAKA